MEIKYEAVFGDQSLFDNAIGDSVAAINHGDVVFCFNSYNAFLIEVMKCNDLPLSDIPEFAMRRIIKVPVISGDIDELITPEFDKWWSEEGEFIRSGGGNYERSFAYGAFRHLMPEILAARGIKKTPVWTMEDQKAGKLPPVGSKYLAGSNKREFTCLFHGKGNGAVSVVGFNSDDEVTGYQLQYCYPIESPEEKAARLRSEWCNRAMDCSTIQQLYDAMLSGDLPVPVKDAKK